MGTDKEIEREVLANEQRKVNTDNDDDKGLVDTLEKGMESFINPLVRPDETVEDVEQQREANDEASRQR